MIAILRWTYPYTNWHSAFPERSSELSRLVRYLNESGQRKRDRQPTKRWILTLLESLIN